MSQLPKYLIPIIAVVIVLVVIGVIFIPRLMGGNGKYTVSGTIEATEIQLGTQFGGRIERVTVDEGDNVTDGELLVTVHGQQSLRQQRRTDPFYHQRCGSGPIGGTRRNRFTRQHCY